VTEPIPGPPGGAARQPPWDVAVEKDGSLLGNRTYSYSPNGELTIKTQNGVTATYQYDELGNLRKVVLPCAATRMLVRIAEASCG